MMSDEPTRTFSEVPLNCSSKMMPFSVIVVYLYSIYIQDFKISNLFAYLRPIWRGLSSHSTRPRNALQCHLYCRYISCRRYIKDSIPNYHDTSSNNKRRKPPYESANEQFLFSYLKYTNTHIHTRYGNRHIHSHIYTHTHTSTIH